MPILMLTAKGEEVDRVVGLELGSDDYVTKPFSMRELMARIKAVLRRSRSQGSLGPAGGEKELSSGDLFIDVARHVVTKDGVALGLAPREFDLLSLLVASKGHVLSREEILRRVWGTAILATAGQSSPRPVAQGEDRGRSQLAPAYHHRQRRWIPVRGLKHFLTLQWRTLLAYTALIVVSMGAVIVSPIAWVAVLAGLAVAVLSIGLGYVLAMRASRSVRSITEAARRIGAETSTTGLSSTSMTRTPSWQPPSTVWPKRCDKRYETCPAKGQARHRRQHDGRRRGRNGCSGNVVLTNQAAETMLRPRPMSRHQTRLMDLLRDHELQGLVESSRESASIRHSEVEMVGPYRLISAIATPLPINGARAHSSPSTISPAQGSLTRPDVNS